MSQLSEQELVRREKLAKLRELGINPYPADLYPVNHTSKQVKAQFEEGKKVIIDQLNALLAYELAAMDQYFIHSQMYLDWGLNKLHERIAHEFEDEKGHATKLIERMLFLEGTPDMVSREGFQVGKDVPSMLESDLRVEYTVTDKLKQAVASRSLRDPVHRWTPCRR